MTTPATKCPCPSVTPEAVRNSVSMFSLMTGARAGIILRSSWVVAVRQRDAPAILVAEITPTSSKVFDSALICIALLWLPQIEHDDTSFLEYESVLILECGDKAAALVQVARIKRRQVGALQIKIRRLNQCFLLVGFAGFCF